VSNLSFSVLGAHSEPYAASPMLSLRLGIAETTEARIHTIALKTQVRIEPQHRRYAATEAERLLDLFGRPARYGDTLRPMLWTHVAQMVLGFTATTEVELSIPCSYDFEVAAHKYLSALEGGEIPLKLLFSGNVFVEGPQGVSSEFVPWTCEAAYRLPVAVWRQAMDAYFPNAAWIRLNRETFDELCRFKAARSLPTWDAVLLELCGQAVGAPGAPA
jgi:Family of unknown function (DUF6084)